jgi:hypothetical protein
MAPDIRFFEAVQWDASPSGAAEPPQKGAAAQVG